MVIDVTCEWSEPDPLRQVSRYLSIPVVDTCQPHIDQLRYAAREATTYSFLDLDLDLDLESIRLFTCHSRCFVLTYTAPLTRQKIFCRTPHLDLSTFTVPMGMVEAPSSPPPSYFTLALTPHHWKQKLGF